MRLKAATKVNTKPYWYHTTMKECVLCGKTDIIKCRMYSPKPNNVVDRYKFEQKACNCHFC